MSLRPFRAGLLLGAVTICWQRQAVCSGWQSSSWLRALALPQLGLG